MPARGKKTQHLTVLLLREDIAEFEDALDAPTDLERLDLAPGLPFEGRFYVQRRAAHEPGWLAFVQSGLAGQLAGVLNAGTAGVLLLRTADRLFAVTFGLGRFLLKSDAYVRDFGLRVVLNAVDPDRLRSIELRVVEEMVISRRTDASRVSTPAAFGLNPGRDILRGVAGQPTDRALYGRQIVGSDAVAANLKVDFEELGEIAGRFLAAYNDTLYRQRFAWIDQVKVVRDKATVRELDGDLVASLARDDEGRPYLAPPTMLPWSNVEFTFTGDRGERHADLDIDDYLENRQALPDIDRLRADDVHAMAVDSGIELDRWSVYACLVFETIREGKTFVLSEAQWFEVAPSLVDEVTTGLRRIAVGTVVMPLARDGEWEGDYNVRAAAAPGRILLDRQLSRVAQEHGPIEICDILTDQRQFVHVKRKTQSATLSHLFAQGRIAAEVFLRDGDLRDRLRSDIAAINPAIASTIPESGERIRTADFEVAYGIISPTPTEIPLGLPFFSRLNLLRTVEYLRDTLGYRASVIGIGIE